MSQTQNKDRPRVLLIGGSLNQTTMIHRVGIELEKIGFECWYSPYYTDSWLQTAAERGLVDFCILGGVFYKNTIEYFKEKNLKVDYKGAAQSYDMMVTCTDMCVPKNQRTQPLIQVQEGMTDPPNVMTPFVKWFDLPCWMASTSATGFSNRYDLFCVASEGYKEFFVEQGLKAEKLIVTGIPNYDNCEQYNDNDFPHHHFALVATSDCRETFKYENRKKTIEEAARIANGKQLIFKLHPNENKERAIREVNQYAPGALVYTSGNIHHMIANCDILITKWSTVSYVGLALGKEVHSAFKLKELKQKLPKQNKGTSAINIANVCRDYLVKHSKKDFSPIFESTIDSSVSKSETSTSPSASL